MGKTKYRSKLGYLIDHSTLKKHFKSLRMYPLQETTTLVSPSRIWCRTLTHIYENYRSFPLAEETKESLQLASLELLTWSSSQLLTEVVDNRYVPGARKTVRTTKIQLITELRWKTGKYSLCMYLKPEGSLKNSGSAFQKAQGFKKSWPHIYCLKACVFLTNVGYIRTLS